MNGSGELHEGKNNIIMNKGQNGKGKMNIQSILQMIFFVFFLAIQPPNVHALTPTQVFDKVKDSIVVVKTLDTQGKVKSQGSGVLISSGKIATNCHVVEGGTSYQVGRGNELVPATLYAEDGEKDICLLDAKGINGKPAQVGKATGLKVGDTVYAVGAPMGLELSLSGGIVAQLRGGPPPFIQTTAAVSHGSSGGGLFDEEGRLVGLTTFYLEDGQSLHFAIPVEWLGEVKPGRKQTTDGRSQTEWLKRSFALEQMKDWHGLLDWCRQWTKSKPKYKEAWYTLGIAYGELNRYNEAIEAYRQAIRIDPEYDLAWNNLGIDYGELKRYNEAIEALRQALRINPKVAGYWYNLGNAYSELKRYNEAIEAYRQALLINKEKASYWYNLGNAYGDLSRYNEAIEAYHQAIRIDPELSSAWYNLGLAYYLSGNRQAALEAVQKLRRYDPARADRLFDLIVPR